MISAVLLVELDWIIWYTLPRDEGEAVTEQVAFEQNIRSTGLFTSRSEGHCLQNRVKEKVQEM